MVWREVNGLTAVQWSEEEIEQLQLDMVLIIDPSVMTLWLGLIRLDFWPGELRGRINKDELVSDKSISGMR